MQLTQFHLKKSKNLTAVIVTIAEKCILIWIPCNTMIVYLLNPFSNRSRAAFPKSQYEGGIAIIIFIE